MPQSGADNGRPSPEGVWTQGTDALRAALEANPESVLIDLRTSDEIATPVAP